VDLGHVKYALTYRYMYEYKAIRLVTWQNNEEYLIVFKKQEL